MTLVPLSCTLGHGQRSTCSPSITSQESRSSPKRTRLRRRHRALSLASLVLLGPPYLVRACPILELIYSLGSGDTRVEEGTPKSEWLGQLSLRGLRPGLPRSTVGKCGSSLLLNLLEPDTSEAPSDLGTVLFLVFMFSPRLR